jgi:hypothetical protein
VAVDDQHPPADFDDADLETAVEALDSARFRMRFIRTDCNADDPEWRVDGGRPIKDYVRDQMDVFKGEVDAVTTRSIHSGVYQKFGSDLWQAIGSNHVLDPVTPAPADLLHVYGPDRDDTGDWRRYYRYAWKDKGPNGIVYSDDATMIRQGKLSCNCYSYSAQNSYTLVGVGLLYRPEWGDAKVSIRPYVQWQTFASFTGNDKAPASASASLGIFVESWKATGGGHNVDSDIMIPAWSQNTQSYLTGITNGGAATVTDGLAADVFAVTQRKYGIFVYAYLETSAGPQQERNELRFATIDIDITVPYVVVEEKPV